MDEAVLPLIGVIGEASLTAILALFFGFIGAAVRSYVTEKGKNLATKQDIRDITRQIEEIKYENEKNLYKSSNLLNRQIVAFDAISTELSELQIYCLRQMARENEHAVPYDDLPEKSTFQRAWHLREVSHTQRVFVSSNIFVKIGDLCERISMLGHAEMHEEKITPVTSDHYDQIRLEAKKIMAMMRKELFSRV